MKIKFFNNFWTKVFKEPQNTFKPNKEGGATGNKLFMISLVTLTI